MHPSIRLHGVTFQKVRIFYVIAVKSPVFAMLVSLFLPKNSQNRYVCVVDGMGVKATIGNVLMSL
jgi:hypothetical protein